MELLTPLETLGRLILRARELEAQIPAEDPDEDPEDVDDLDDEGDQALSVLEDELNTGVEEEVQALLDDLADDQLAETLTLAWVGRGTYDASEWERPSPRRRSRHRRANGRARIAPCFTPGIGPRRLRL
jgi:hypothetical protein